MTEEIDPTAGNLKYPAIILENLELLYRHGILDPKKNFQGEQSQKKSTEAFDKTVFQNQWYTADLIIMFGCYRRDYEHLLYPVANSLADKGLRIHAVIHDKTSPNLAMLSKKIKIIHYSSFVRKHNLHQLANKNFSELYENDLHLFSQKSRLNAVQKRNLFGFYKRYAFDKLFTEILIGLLRPKCVLGIHFVLTPGCVGAIKSAPFPVFLSLIQHGLISADKERQHDFWGADLVFLWGDFFQELLKEKDNAPQSVVLGNPKMEQVISDLKRRKEEKKNHFTILYIFTGSPKENFNRSNLTLFFKSIQHTKNCKVTYKLHPNSSIADCRTYIRKGMMNESQIIKNADIYTLINRSDLIIGDFSTSIFEAAALKKPVIQIYQSNYPKTYLKFSIVQSSLELTEIIKKLQSNTEFYDQWIETNQKHIPELFNQLEGSIGRISDHIKHLLDPV